MASAPAGRSRTSASATRTAGAICTTTVRLGSPKASQAPSTSLAGTRAPVGQTRLHWPQLMQSASPMPRPKAGCTVVSEPRKAKSRAPTPCTSLHMRTQSPHSTHLPGSRWTEGLVRSAGFGAAVRSKRTRSTPRRRDRSCRRQSASLSQVVQWPSWLASSNSSVVLRSLRSWGVAVFTTMPGSGVMEHEAWMPLPSISTTHRRQAP